MRYVASNPFTVRVPGRVCLFGEHSDYLGLDVIAAAIDLAIAIDVTPREDDTIHAVYHDLNEEDSFALGSEVEYRHRRDYVRSAFNVMYRRGFVPHHGYNLEICGSIPISAGLSSSSALTVATICAISKMAKKTMTLDEIAIAAYNAEVAEFGESGGKMDHYACAFGGIIHVNMETEKITQLPARLGSIVIGDSGEKKKDTVGDLRYIRTTVEKEFETISKDLETFNRRTTPVKSLYELPQRNVDRARIMAEATLVNRDLTYRALELLKSTEPYEHALGAMLKEHHEILRDGLGRSTPKIERMIDAAYEAGALGCKINGSGGGGTMMAYAADWEQEVASAIQKVAGTTFIVKTSEGVIIKPM